MADECTNDGVDRAAGVRRPLWAAGLAGLVTATLLAWIVILSWVAYDNARLDDAHMFEGDGNVRPAAPFTSDWWASAALAFPKIALVALAYAVPLMAIIALGERRHSRSRLVWPLAGGLAMAPLACAWIVLAASSPHIVPAHAVFGPVMVLVAIGMLGAGAAAAIRNGSRR